VQGEVIGAFYYDLKEANRVRGWALNDRAQEFGSLKKGALASADQKSELLDEVREVLGKAVSQMAQGEFAPVPKSEKECSSCHWSRLCRAPHLI